MSQPGGRSGPPAAPCSGTRTSTLTLISFRAELFLVNGASLARGRKNQARNPREIDGGPEQLFPQTQSGSPRAFGGNAKGKGKEETLLITENHGG